MTEALLAAIEDLLDKPSPPTVNVVELDAVTRFAEAVGAPIVDDDGRVLVPPTFLGSLRYRRPPMPGDAEDRMVIVNNALTLARPPVIGERITTSAAFTEARARGPFIVLKLACRYTDEAQAEVAVFTCSWLIQDEDDRPAPAEVKARVRNELLTSRATVAQTSVNGHGGPDPVPVRAWDVVDPGALRPGDELPPLVKPALTTLQFVKYAGASHDFNPIHYDAHFAARAGFPDVIAPGLMKMAFFAEHMTLWANRWACLRHLEAKYEGIDLPGTQLTSHATVRSVTPEADGRYAVALDLSLRDERGEVRTSGKAIVTSGAP
jgi:acyl dehydratase